MDKNKILWWVDLVLSCYEQEGEESKLNIDSPEYDKNFATEYYEFKEELYTIVWKYPK